MAAVAYEPIPLLDYMPALSRRLQRPDPLAPIARAFERALTERVFVFATTPPQHGKTEILQHGIAWSLQKNPSLRIAYGSYGAQRAFKISRQIRQLYRKAGGRLEKDARSVADWRTGVDQGGLWASGVGGAWTGEGFDLIVIDDPIKGRVQAESAVYRERLWDWYSADLETRVAPTGSIIVVHTRWTVDDLGGRLIAGQSPYPFEQIHLPAIDTRGRALWEARRPLEDLKLIRAKLSRYDWESLYMGRPFNRGGKVFFTERYYDVRPANLRVAVGVDMAYSSKTSSDWSAIVVLGIDDYTEKLYVLDVIRLQLPAPDFAIRLKYVLEQWRAQSARWYYAGPEKGIIDFLRTLDVDIEAMPASAQKFIRAQPVAAAWNGPPPDDGADDGERGEGRIFLPRSAPWLPAFLSELSAFTGVEDLHDDQVDAFAAAFDAIAQPDWVVAMNRFRARGGVM